MAYILAILQYTGIHFDYYETRAKSFDTEELILWKILGSFSSHAVSAKEAEIEGICPAERTSSLTTSRHSRTVLHYHGT